MNKSKRESSKKQRQLIAMACSHFDITRDDKQILLCNRYGKKSTTDLSFAQAEELIDSFVEQGFVIKSEKRRYISRKKAIKGGKKRKTGTVVAMATPAELAKIDALSGLIEWRRENGKNLWIKKRFGIDRVKTGEDAFKVIEGLKGMFENQMKKLHGAQWYRKDFEDIEICRFIAEYFSAQVYGALPAYARIGN
jgi:hypothetical protein